MKFEKNIETLDQSLWQTSFIFQDDNAPCHTSQLTTAWKIEND